MKTFSFLLAFLFTTLSLRAQTVVDIVVNSTDHNTLEAAVLAAGLETTLSGPGPFTLFAPTDAAFDAIDPADLQALLDDPSGFLTNILLYHTLPGEVLSTDLANGQMPMTLNNGATVMVSINADGVFINNAEVTMANIPADNGVVHVIDAVLVPNTINDIVTNSAVHTTLEFAIDAAGLAGTLSGEGPFTLFAPTDAAFDALPAGLLASLVGDPFGALTDILLYHVLEGEVLSTDLSNAQVATTINGVDVIVTIDGPDVFINNALVTMANIPADNGVVHVIDAVLVPNTITDLVVYSPIHTTLETAVVEAGLAATLSGAGPFTVFAPTDDAFDALPAGALADLLADPTGALADVLLYHAVEGAAFSTDLSDGQIIPTINGEDVTVDIDMDGNVFINEAQVIVADINTANGVVHVIDAVLIPPSNTVVDIIVNSPDHNILETAVIEAGLAGTLSGEGRFTVFAPTDDAFDALPAGLLDDLLADPTGALTDILLYHALEGEVLSTDLSNAQVATTINGVDVIVTIDGPDVFINNALVTMANIPADNGVVHVIDAVLVPNTITDLVVYSPIHTTLETAVVVAGLAGTLSGDGPFTVFAPTDDAFDALPAGALDDLLADPTGALADVLLYHAVEGAAFSTDLTDGQIIPTINGEDVTVDIDMDGNVFINEAQVIVADINTANGVVHVINAVLLPPSPSNTIVDIVVNSPDHNILETAVIEAGLAGTLSGDGPFTVFAPTDDAFDALPAGLLDDLLADPTGALADILLYHALEGEVLSTDLSNAQVATTINGVDVIVTIDGPDVFINNALVTMANIPADNGVVHVIDAVLVPNTITDLVVYSPIHTTLETAVVAAGLAGTLSGDGPFTVFAPTDDAFDALPAGALDDLLIDPTGALADVLLYHAVEGAAFSTDLSDGQIIPTINGKDVTVTIDTDGNVFINDAQVIVADINTANGVVHVINAVLLPPSNTVVDIIVNSPDHNTLETAVIEAGLAGTLSGEGPFTVFAPTDAAFDALPAGALDDLLADPTGALTDVLTYHVAEGAVLSTDLSNGQNVEMLNMESVTITIDGSNVFVNDAQVTMADIDADNGVVHVINGVLLPPTAVNELATEFADVKVFPNPATDFVTIDLNRADANIEQVILANANGQIIEVRKENTNRLNYNLKAVPSGTYYLILTIDGTRFSQSVQVQH